ncbi:MAG TPA: hypothetical protein VGI92_14195 [Gemmatimonadales bacterium]
MRHLSRRAAFAFLAVCLTSSLPAQATRSRIGCADAPPTWIWCDDFEVDRIHSYFEYDGADGRFTREAGVGRGGSYGMRVRYLARIVGAGHLSLAMGKTPDRYFRTIDSGRVIYRDIYWRVFMRLQPGWNGGGGYKLSRVMVMATPAWAEAAIAHVWSGRPAQGNTLLLDPASGTDPAGALRTTKYNDFDHLRWLGLTHGHAPIFDPGRAGQWVCIEAHARLNDPGQSNGVEELWIDGRLDARVAGINYLGSFSQYGWNALNLENYWNDGAPRDEERYLDDFVVATERIGC